MEPDDINRLADRLRRWNYTISPGLSDREISDIEARFHFHFPPDLRQFLQQIFPTSHGWVDWRSGPEAEIQGRLDWPLDGMIFDIEQNSFWMEDWGQKPEVLSDAIAIARHRVAMAPTLIPIVGHRYIPAEPPLAGNPVFSVYQTDIIYYGYDLASYFENEFSEGPNGYHVSGDYQPDIFQKVPRPIRFWDKIMAWDETDA